ncbi:conserved hypothetical protein [Rubrivivax sp. A210]|uniref:hypothetical protein n=1 Tax=Rubrivivax sp. A210 TaxID=2772301 RepID=UPI00191A13EB|nr:hypothetical protein [Rubrivivax sp. A210]CAD5373345.1 conserved hypothetical protein [Rubrivivax sp. A210]
MKSRTRLFILVTLALALWWARDRLLPAEVAAPVRAAARAPRPALAAAPARPALPTAVKPATAELPQRGAFGVRAAGDPFASIDAAAPVARAVAVAAPPAPPPPPPAVAPPPPAPPGPPYRYLGALSEKGQPPSVFLALGPAVIQARAGDSLEGGWRLDSIAARELVFTHTVQKRSARMGVDGEPQ